MKIIKWILIILAFIFTISFVLLATKPEKGDQIIAISTGIFVIVCGIALLALIIALLYGAFDFTRFTTSKASDFLEKRSIKKQQKKKAHDHYIRTGQKIPYDGGNSVKGFKSSPTKGFSGFGGFNGFGGSNTPTGGATTFPGDDYGYAGSSKEQFAKDFQDIFGNNQTEYAPNGWPKDPTRNFSKQDSDWGKQACNYQCEYVDENSGRCFHQGDDLHADHWFPHSKGGATTRDNLVMLCPDHNYKKSAKVPNYYQTRLLELSRSLGYGYRTKMSVPVGKWYKDV